MAYSAADLEWLSASGFPYRFDGAEIKLHLRFGMSYNSATDQYALNPDTATKLDSAWIFQGDEYTLCLRWPQGQSYPDCYEEAPRKILAHARLLGIPFGELHLNSPDWSLCLAEPQDLDMRFAAGFSLQVYIEQYVIPFLFSQTHYRKEEVWPWPPAGHGASGVLEWYWRYDGDDLQSATRLTAKHLVSSGGISPDQLKVLLRKHYKGHKPCLYHTDQRIRNCCRDAQFGLNKLVRNRYLI